MPPLQQQHRPSALPLRVRLGLASLLLVLLAGSLWMVRLWLKPHHPSPVAPASEGEAPPDPRLVYAGPYRNIHPETTYVGDARCAECHLTIAASYARHPMARTLRPVAAAVGGHPIEKHHNPFTGFGLHFEVLPRAKGLMHRLSAVDEDGKTVAHLDQEVSFAIGSDALGSSWLALRDGCLIQTPISWYSRKRIWDLSTGFTQDLLTGRSVPVSCLFCHAGRAEAEAGYRDRFATPVLREGYAIGCERCHGPGEKHVAERQRGDPVSREGDHSIVNPGDLPWRLRENVCEQCHLEGEARIVQRGRGMHDFRPGLPLEKFWAIYVDADRAGSGRRAVNHVEQMRASVCFHKSKEDRKLGCISCHNPHQRAEEGQRVAWYRQRCLECHKDRGCKVHLAERWHRVPGDSCIDCHMKRYTTADIAHTASTDHRILRRPGEGEALSGDHGVDELVRFHPVIEGSATEEQRNLGLALVERLLSGHGDVQRDPARALPLLEMALARAPADGEAWIGKGIALTLLRRNEEALGAFRGALARRPLDERAVVGAARAAQLTKDSEAAIQYWRQAIRISPYVPGSRQNLTRLLERQEKWKEVESNCREWIRLDPFSILARRVLVRCLLKQGKKQEARQELDVVLRLLPPDKRPEMHAWFRQVSAERPALPPTQ